MRGDKIAEIVGNVVAEKNLPISELTLQFLNGVLKIEGKARAKLAIPFKFEVRKIVPSGDSIRVPLEQMSAFWFLPVPDFLFQIAASKMKTGPVTFDAAEQAVVIRLDQLLPHFLDLKIDRVGIIDGGLAVALGRGGADLPPAGGTNGRA